MNNFLNKIKENKVTLTSSIVLALLLVILLVFYGDLFVGNRQTADISESKLVKDLLDNLQKQSNPINSVGSAVEELKNPNIEVINGLTYYKKVMIPVLSNPDLFDHDGKSVNGCGDEMVWVWVDVELTRAPLTSSIKKMLEFNNDLGFKPGNFLASQNKLSLKEVLIENEIAKIYLEGEFTLKNECDSARQFVQLDAVALQYNTVKGVQIYLNNELLR